MIIAEPVSLSALKPFSLEFSVAAKFSFSRFLFLFFFKFDSANMCCSLGIFIICYY